jgi:hypothetical protein
MISCAKKKQISFFFLVFFFLLLFGGLALGQEGAPLELQYPFIPGTEAPTTTRTVLPVFVQYIFNFSLLIAGLVAFGSLVFGGIGYLTSAGSPVKQKEARNWISAGLLGLIILLSSYIILNTINPELIILSLPVLEKISLPSPPTVTPAEKPTLIADEIPLGKLIDGVGEEAANGSPTSPLYEYEGVLAKTRLERIQNLSYKIWETAEEIQKTSEKIEEAAERIKELTDECRCRNCGFADNNCKGCYSCAGCSCKSWPEGDPCPGRETIEKKQGELRQLSSNLDELKDEFNDLREELNSERGKLKNALEELEEAETLMRTCPYSLNEEGKGHDLFGFDSFWGYKQGMESVKEIKIEKPWEAIVGGNDPSTFYCAEAYLDVSLSNVEVPEFTETPEEIDVIGRENISCSIEIPIGSVIEHTEDIADRLIKEMARMRSEMNVIINEISKEQTNAERMAELPDGCRCENCHCQCCACCCCDDCCCCCVAHCLGLPCRPLGEIPATFRKIQNNHCVITAAFENVVVSDDEIHNLISGDEIHNSALKGSERKPVWAYHIINEDLPKIRDKLGSCVNTDQNWIEAIAGMKTLTKHLVPCQTALSVLAEKRLINIENLNEALDACSLPGCVKITSCVTSPCSDYVHSTKCDVCGEQSVSHQTPFCIKSDYSTSDRCPDSSDLKTLLTQGSDRTFYLLEEEICKLEFFCCNEINYFCCHSD